MTAVEATLWAIGSIVALGMAWAAVQRVSPGLLRDRGAGALVQALVYVALLALVRFVYFPATRAGVVLGARPGRWVFYPIALLLGLAIQFPASGLYEAIIARFPATPPSEEFAEAFSTLPMWKKMTAAAGLVVTTPLVEEAFFRGALFGTLRRHHGAVTVVIMTSMLFALIHIQPQLFLPIGMVGAAIAFLRVASGSIWPGVLCHMAFNGLTFWAIAAGASESSPASEPTPVLEVVIGTVVTAGLLALTDHLRPRDADADRGPSEEQS